MFDFDEMAGFFLTESERYRDELIREFKRVIDRGCNPNDDDVQEEIFRKVRCDLSDLSNYDQRVLKQEIERYCRRRW